MAIRMNRYLPPRQSLTAGLLAWEPQRKWNPQILRPHLSARLQLRPQMNHSRHHHCHHPSPTPVQYSVWPRCSIALKLAGHTRLLLSLLHSNWRQMGERGTHSLQLLSHRSPTLPLPQHHQQMGISSPPLPDELIISVIKIMNDVANELLHGGFTYLFMKFFIILFKSLINLSASNGVSMHFQGCIEEPYSSIP